MSEYLSTLPPDYKYYLSEFVGDSNEQYRAVFHANLYNMEGTCHKLEFLFSKWLMLYTRLALPVAVCIAIPGRYTRLAWLVNPNPKPNPTNPIYG